MTVTVVAQYLSDGLELALVIRLLSLRLHSVYRVFCAFLIVDLFSSAAFFVSLRYPSVDYRLVWMIFAPATWILALWMLYALLDAMLANLPGILRLSRKVLNFVYVLALAIALFTARPEYSASGLSANPDPVNRAFGVALVLDRAISTGALLALVGMLVFILWFPVQMPKNLVIFSIGSVVFFATTTVLWLAHTYLPFFRLRSTSNLEVILHSACFAYWLILITRAGETKPVRIGHMWGPAEQKRLEGQLEAMNAALLRASRRENYREL